MGGMAGIFQNPTTPVRRASYRQRQYLAARKTDRPTKNVKHEQNIQKEARDWFVKTFPGEHLRSDTGAGAFNSRFEKNTHNEQQSHLGEPDITVLAARRGYHGMLIELKADCHCDVKVKHEDCAIRMQANGKVARVYKNSRGKIIGRDLRPRLKGEWKDLHTERQARVLEDYNQRGYFGRFAIGLEAFKQFCCWYFDVPYEPPTENETMF